MEKNSERDGGKKGRVKERGREIRERQMKGETERRKEGERWRERERRRERARLGNSGISMYCKRQPPQAN